MLRLDALSAEPVLDYVAAPSLDAATQRIVDVIWEREQRQRPAMFDGQVFSLIAQEGHILRGCLVSYRRFIAQRRDPTLFPLLRVRPLAVSGLLNCRDGLVFGQRATATTQDGGRWELAPSGGIDANTPTPRDALMQELAEELGCPAASVTAATAFALVEDDATHTVDIGYALETNLSGAELRGCYLQTASAEYDAVAIVSRDALSTFLAAHDVIEVSHALLKERGIYVAKT
jgi:8-oxo-dGTP pyrophosphatase MutT (NUDIX family)